MLEAVIFVVFPFCMAFAAISDTLSMTIANRISAVLIIVFAAVAPLTGMDWATYGMHFAAAGLVLIGTFGLFALGGMGGGDAKLLAATALWMGMGMPLVEYLVFSAIIGGALTLAIVMYRNSSFAPVTVNNTFLRHFADTHTGVPYGIALGVGGLIAFADSPLVEWALARLTVG